MTLPTTMDNPSTNSIKETHSQLDWRRRALLSTTGPDVGAAVAPSPAIEPDCTAFTLAGSGYARLNTIREVGGFAFGRPTVTVDSLTFREALGRFASGVCVATTVGENGRPAGVTISAFASLSLEPPLVLFCIGKRSANLSAWLTSRYFSINVLSEDQAHVSETFATQNHEKFASVAGSLGRNGCFRIDDCLVTLECRRTRIHDEGDHYIIIGLVEDARFGADAKPLLRFRAAYGRLD